MVNNNKGEKEMTERKTYTKRETDTMWLRIADKDITELSKSDDLMKFAESYMIDLYRNDRNRFTIACDLTNKLGLGGLWRGVHIAQMLIAEKIANGG